VRKNLKRYIDKNIVSIKIRIEKIVLIAFDIKTLISFRLIQREEKNFTSSRVLAFITIKPIKAHPIIKAMIAIIQRNHISFPIEVFWSDFLVTFFSSSRILIRIFSQKADGTVLDMSLYFLSLT